MTLKLSSIRGGLKDKQLVIMIIRNQLIDRLMNFI